MADETKQTTDPIQDASGSDLTGDERIDALRATLQEMAETLNAMSPEDRKTTLESEPYKKVRRAATYILNMISGTFEIMMEVMEEDPEKYRLLREHTRLVESHGRKVLERDYDDTDPGFKEKESLFTEVWDIAIDRYNKKTGQEDLENIQGRRLKEWTNPTDKNTALFFSAAALPRPDDIPGQLSFLPANFDAEHSMMIRNSRRGKTRNGKPLKDAILYLAYRTDSETMTRLSKRWGDDYATNFFVTFAASNLYMAGNKKITLSQLFRAMPGKQSGSPNAAQLSKLRNNVLQVITTTVYINPKEIAEQWGLERYKEIIGPVLPGRFVRERMTINGAVTDEYLEMSGVSPFLQLASEMKQIQPVNLKVLDIKLSRTETAYRVLYYLLRQVLWMQRPGTSRKEIITYDDLFAAVQATTRKKRYSVKDQCFKILEQWREVGFISGYSETTTDATPGVQIDSKNLLTG